MAMARTGGKSAAAFRTISEVSQQLDVPQHVLRFWETKFPQIRPLKRGGGRRYYRPEDIDLLRRIRELLYGEGYTIRGVQRLLRETGAKAVGGDGAKAVASDAKPVAKHSLDQTRREELTRLLKELEELRNLLVKTTSR